MQKPEFQSVHYDKHITHALGLDNQKLKLDAAKDTKEKIYLDPEGAEIIEILDDTVKNERRVLGHCTFKIYDEPFPFFYASWGVRKRKPLPKQNSANKQVSVGDLIMERINTFIKEKKCRHF